MLDKEMLDRIKDPDLYRDSDPEDIEYPSIVVYDDCKLLLAANTKAPLWLELKLPQVSWELAPSGSIDLHWENDKVELLINVSEDKITFYGDKQHNRKESISGTLDIYQNNSWIFQWFVNSAGL